MMLTDNYIVMTTLILVMNIIISGLLPHWTNIIYSCPMGLPESRLGYNNYSHK